MREILFEVFWHDENGEYDEFTGCYADVRALCLELCRLGFEPFMQTK